MDSTTGSLDLQPAPNALGGGGHQPHISPPNSLNRLSDSEFSDIDEHGFPRGHGHLPGVTDTAWSAGRRYASSPAIFPFSDLDPYSTSSTGMINNYPQLLDRLLNSSPSPPPFFRSVSHPPILFNNHHRGVDHAHDGPASQRHHRRELPRVSPETAAHWFRLTNKVLER